MNKSLSLAVLLYQALPLLDGSFQGTDRFLYNIGNSVNEIQRAIYFAIASEIVEMAYYLLRNEGLFVGPSAGQTCKKIFL